MSDDDEDHADDVEERRLRRPRTLEEEIDALLALKAWLRPSWARLNRRVKRLEIAVATMGGLIAAKLLELLLGR